MIDLLVIGAGLSGLVAAQTAADAGLRVRIISKGLNALHWSAGTVDVLGYLPDVGTPVEAPLGAVESLQRPEHPYRRLGRQRVEAVLNDFVSLSQRLALPYKGAAAQGINLLLPSPAGAARPSFLAPEAQHNGNLREQSPMLIVGFHRLRDFYPELIAENLSRQGYQARAAFLPIALITDRDDFNTVQLAGAVERPEHVQRLGKALQRLARPGERIGLPAMLGMERHNEVMAQLQKTTGATIFEIPTLPPSVPGIRLFRRLQEHLRQSGVRVEAGMEAIGASTSGRPPRVDWVATETSARPLRHRARYFLLATGGILGGGFASDHTGRVREVVFDLPLSVPQRRNSWFRTSFLDPRGHPVFEGGVRVNDAGQPVDEDGHILYENLWAAGDVLAGADPIQERSLEGIAIATGAAAGQSIVATHTAVNGTSAVPNGAAATSSTRNSS